MNSSLRVSCASHLRLVLIAGLVTGALAPALAEELPTVVNEDAMSGVETILPTESLIPADNPIGGIVLTKRHPLLLRADFSRISDSVAKIYQAHQFKPIWFTDHPSTKNLNDLLGILENAGNDGLRPEQYDLERVKALVDDQPQDADTIASHDVALTVSLVRFLHELRQGRVEPRDVKYPVHIAPKPPLDIAELLSGHLASETLNELVPMFEPKAKQYQQLKHMLNRLQASGDSTPDEWDDFRLTRSLRPGDKHSDVALLRKRIKALGGGNGNDDTDSASYDSRLAMAVKAFQHEHGLKADGVVGPATAALLARSSREKIEQIELAMERARWIPDTTDGPLIVVNIPAFELWAFSSADDRNPLNMKVVVGKAPDNQTPLLWEEMKYLEFMPYWNIPKTIFQKEILPKVANNEGYLASQEIELVRHYNREDQGGGSYIRARQRPGKKNPLGRVKFVFPNTADVYLHDTPSRTAFNRTRRDLSHGCVRVSEPEQLAEFVLGDQQGWDKETIRQAMSAPKTRHVTLKRSVPVLFYYGTTFVDHEDKLRFYPDVYGQDEQLKRALEKVQSPSIVSSNSAEHLANKVGDLVVAR